MKNLQDIYDAYLETRPSTGKIRTASSMMIHVCKALDISSQEEVTVDYFESIPRALDSFYLAHPTKATMDKTILAEMIGRVGPKKKVHGLLDKLLADKDQNVRQFTLNSMEYYGTTHPRVILPYIERFRQSSDQEMKSTVARLVGNLQCSAQSQFILDQIKKWYNKGDTSFVQEVIGRMVILRRQRKCDRQYMNLKELSEWAEINCPNVAIFVFGK